MYLALCYIIFCVFVRKMVSAMASMAIINVECDLITGLYGSVKPGMISIYMYCDDIWFSGDISEHIATFTTNPKNPYLVVLILL